MANEKIYLLVQTEVNDEENNSGEYSILRENPTEIAEGFEVTELNIEHTDKLQMFVILDEDKSDAHVYDVVRLYTDKDSLQDVINAVRSIPGYTEEDLHTVIWEVFKGEPNPEDEFEIVHF
ncbi:hypothetical protein CVD28_03200 [Bacillus sp. M6-12]|uniref:hypothetical protein n=1 Tax=Bacillus sp. M6-12 TaxID=2054166 RepID=UPI000C759A85|nr:hypothetical protein [Bacillus sp. M6-12]PLS19437.1 hypothetical protein CVD28_03200 [Bacillus sp. M6-12]